MCSRGGHWEAGRFVGDGFHPGASMLPVIPERVWHLLAVDSDVIGKDLPANMPHVLRNRTSVQMYARMFRAAGEQIRNRWLR